MPERAGLIGLLLVLLMSEVFAATGATDYQPRLEDYAFNAVLEEASDTLQRVRLPGDLLAVLTRSDLGDVAVFDGAGTPMLTWVRPRKSPPLTGTRPLKFYPFTDSRIISGREETVTVTRDEGGRLETYDKFSQPAQTEEVLSHYIIELPSSDEIPVGGEPGVIDELYGFRLDWHHEPETRLLSVGMEVSPDLNHWQLIRARQSLTHRLDKVNGPRGQEIRVEPGRLKGQRYLRLSLNEPVSAFQIHAVEGLYRRPGSVVYHWVTGERLAPDETDPAYLAFSIPYRVRPAGFRFRFEEANQIIQGDLYSRPLRSDQRIRRMTHIVQHNVDYREAESGTDLKSDVIPLKGIADIRWWFLPTRKLAVWPRVEFAMPDYELLFFASGNGPYQLAWGNRDAGPADGHLKRFASENGLAKLIAAREALGDIPEVSLQEVTKADPTRLMAETSSPLLKWVLWVVLAMTVVFTGRMALHLYREIQSREIQNRET